MNHSRRPTSTLVPAEESGGRPARLPRWHQRVLHALGIAVGWGLFVWFWVVVAGRDQDARELRLVVLGALVMVQLLTLGWVIHNVGLYRRRGPRRTVPHADTRYRMDFNGRRIVADWRLLGRVRHAEIGVAGELKFYRFTRAARSREERTRTPVSERGFRAEVGE